MKERRLHRLTSGGCAVSQFANSGFTKRGLFIWIGMICAVTLAGSASAHGPTIKLTNGTMSPGLLNLFVGTTVHFLNTDDRPSGHIIVDNAGRLESPAMKTPGEGWHFTFEEEGTYELHLRGYPDAKARIVVIPKRSPTAVSRPPETKGSKPATPAL